MQSSQLMQRLVCGVLLFVSCQHGVYGRPQNRAYNYAEKAIAGGSPVEDHSEHLSNVANAYRGTDQTYNNYPNVSE